MHSIDLLSNAKNYTEEKLNDSIDQESQAIIYRGIPFMLLGAVVEELFFRGFLIPLFLPFGALIAILISTITHWLSHFINPNFRLFTEPFEKILASSGFFITTLGIAILFVYTKSLIPALTVHLMASVGFGALISRKTA